MKFMKGCLTLAAVMMITAAAQAEVVIDNFGNSSVTNNLIGVQNGAVVALTGDVTGTRQFTSSSGFVSTTTGGGGLNVVATAGTAFSLKYNFAAAVDLKSPIGAANAGNPLRLNMVQALSGAFSLVASYTSGVTTYSFAPVAINSAGIINFNSLLPGIGTIAASVNSVRFDFAVTAIDGGTGLATFSASNASLTAVPEPATLALLGLTAVVGGVVVHRRRRSQIAA